MTSITFNYVMSITLLIDRRTIVNSIKFLHLGGGIRNIKILLLLSLSFGTVTDIDGNVYETPIQGLVAYYPFNGNANDAG